MQKVSAKSHQEPHFHVFVTFVSIEVRNPLAKNHGRSITNNYTLSTLHSNETDLKDFARFRSIKISMGK